LDTFAGDREDDLLGLFSTDTQDAKDCIGIKHSTFSWSNDSDGTYTPSRRTFLLRVEDEVLFKPHAINLIVGPTGSGKTSMLMALLGERSPHRSVFPV
jgi:ABC-type multidrug transport system fused ATPase/permease subunit